MYTFCAMGTKRSCGTNFVLTFLTINGIVSVTVEQIKVMKRNSTIISGIQRAGGWCETAERTIGTRLGASAQNPTMIRRVDADGFLPLAG